MYLVSSTEMSLLEEKAAEMYSLSPRVLMEAAGIAAFNYVREILGEDLQGKRILICAGRGNNGGDALVLARYLGNAAATVRIALTNKPEQFQGPAAEALRSVTAMVARDVDEKLLAGSWDLIVDGLIGTGLQGAVTGLTKELVGFINNQTAPVLALDIPTGVNADTGEITDGCCVQADYTITFGLPKIGLFCYPAPDYVGKLRVDAIGLPLTSDTDLNLTKYLIEPSLVQALLPQRPQVGHKGTFGHALTIGGSPGMLGAPCLAALGALRVGAGKSTVAGPARYSSLLATKLTEVMTMELADNQGYITTAANKALVSSPHRYQAVLVGPGLGTNFETGAFLQTLISQTQCPLVLDADALNLMADQHRQFQSLLAQRQEPVILTPHPGEMGRLMGLGSDQVQANRVEVAQAAAERWSAVVILKGAHTLVATPDGRLYLNPTGNSSLATAGTGDVLAGVIVGLLAQGMQPWAAAVCGTYLHGLAGDKAAQAGYGVGLIAGDLLNYLPLVLQKYMDK